MILLCALCSHDGVPTSAMHLGWGQQHLSPLWTYQFLGQSIAVVVLLLVGVRSAVAADTLSTCTRRPLLSC